MTFFVNIGYKLDNKISACHCKPLEYIPRTVPIISTFKPPDIQEISDVIDELKTYSAGYDNASVFLVKQVKQSLLQPLVHIFSLSLKTGAVPEDVKVAKVIPLF